MSKIEIQPISFIDGLALLFIALKLCGVINWNWIWVLTPIWSVVIVDLIAVLLIKIWQRKYRI